MTSRSDIAGFLVYVRILRFGACSLNIITLNTPVGCKSVTTCYSKMTERFQSTVEFSVEPYY